MEMQIKQTTIGGLIITHSEGVLLDLDTTAEYKQNKITNSQLILSRKDEFKTRGTAVVKSELVYDWIKMMDISFQDEIKIHYNGAIIEACLECMELLSNNQPIEDCYKPIDVNDSENPAIHCNMILSGWQNSTATSIIATYHERGAEFYEYRNKYVKR